MRYPIATPRRTNQPTYTQTNRCCAIVRQKRDQEHWKRQDYSNFSVGARTGSSRKVLHSPRVCELSFVACFLPFSFQNKLKRRKIVHCEKMSTFLVECCYLMKLCFTHTHTYGICALFLSAQNNVFCRRRTLQNKKKELCKIMLRRM